MINFKVSAPNTDVQDASAADILMNMKYPLAKLDTKNPVSFQDINFTFFQEPPNASVGNTLDTLVDFFPHGYTYAPTSWSLIKVITPPSTNFYQAYFQETGLLSAQNPGDQCLFFVTVDEKNVNFWVRKYFQSGVTPATIAGVVLQIRVYVFVDGVKDS